jgi:hypothetical protein
LHILSSEADLPEGMILVILKISKRYFKNPMFQPLGSNLLKTSQIQFEQTTKQTPENIPEFYIQ